MSKNEFKAGDRVRLKKSGTIASVVIAKDGWIAYDENRRIGGACPMEEAEPIDSKTAFLSELKGLLEKYGAKMSADVSGPDLDCAEVDMLFVIGDDEIRFDVTKFDYFITPDNIAETACYEKK